MKKKNILWYGISKNEIPTTENRRKLSPKAIFLLCVLFFLICLPPPLYAQQKDQAKPKTEKKKQIMEIEQTQPGKISLNIKDVDITEILKILALNFNLNIIVGKNVRGEVTFFLKNVDLMEVLEIILSANGLAYEKKGDIINVMTEVEYELLYGEKSYNKKEVKVIQLEFAKAAEVAKILTQIKSNIGKIIADEDSNTMVLIDAPQSVKEMVRVVKNVDLPTTTKTFVLNYANAKELATKIEPSLSKNLGNLQIDERMNKIVVTDLPEKIDYITRVISDFDERDKVVLIEAKIIQVTLSKDIGYGINWNNVFAGIDTIAKSDLTINLPGITAPTTFTYVRAHGATEYGDTVILNLLDKLGKTNVLSTPRITVANKQEAKVLVGTKEAFVTTKRTWNAEEKETTYEDTVSFVDVGVSLSVTPTITDDGYVNIKIKPEVSSTPRTVELKNADGTVRSSIPIVATSEAETQLLVKDGTTIILAGLMKDAQTDNTEKIPGLGDIPLLGRFFQSRGKESEKTELVIFLTPHIIKEGEDVSQDAQEYLQQHEKTGVKAGDKPAYRPLSIAKARKAVSSIPSKIDILPRDFQQYCRYLRDRIACSIEKNAPGEVKGQEIRLIFVLAADGSLKEEPKLLGDVDKRIKDLTIKGIEDASPFFPFPEDHKQPEETFRLTICFEENL